MQFNIEKVTNSRLEKIFLELPHSIYKNDPNWVCPLNVEISAIFHPKKNSFFQHGFAARWIISDDMGIPLGRIAAFINEKKAAKYDVPTGGIGFFECIHDQSVADALFEVAHEWLSERGMQAVEGPINFGENDRHWGLLVEGFTPTAFGMSYHRPYYSELFESYGFEESYRQLTRDLSLIDPLPERFLKIGEWIAKKPEVEFCHVSSANLNEFAHVFQAVYNDAWQFLAHFTPITDEQMKGFVKEFKHFIIKPLMPFAKVNGEPAAFIVCLPDLNQIIRPFKGEFPWWRQLLFKWRSRNGFQWYLEKGILTRGRVVIMGVRPKFQRYGLEAGLIMSSLKDAQALGFKSIELSWVGDFNNKMRRLHEATGAKNSHVHITYQYRFTQS